MKSLHNDAPPASRPVPEVCGNVFGNGQAVDDGSGSGAGCQLPAGGTSLGIPLGTVAAAGTAAPTKTAPATSHPPSRRRLIGTQHTYRAPHVRRFYRDAAAIWTGS